jgi:hypothetical protein
MVKSTFEEALEGVDLSITLKKDYNDVNGGDSLLEKELSFEPKGEISITNGITIPEDIEQGIYYIVANVDADDEIEELTEANNRKFCKVAYKVKDEDKDKDKDDPKDDVNITKGDLKFDTFRCPTTTLKAGDSLDEMMNVIVANTFETKQEGVGLRIFISKNKNISLEGLEDVDRDDIENGVVDLTTMEIDLDVATATQVKVEDAKLPDDLEDGAYFVYGVIDSDKVVEENIETNNLGVCGIKVGSKIR